MKKISKDRFSHWFDDMFGFEQGIDISDETQVLFRRNVVIKNIIFISNIVYTILLTFFSAFNSQRSNWILTVILFPLTFLINITLKRMIFREKDDFMHQQIAMYFACFYMFISSVLIYMKLKNSDSNFGEAGYILIYYSLVVVSLYQDKKMLKTVCIWLLVLITILHFTITYSLISTTEEGSIFHQINSFIHSLEFSDILLRTIILCAFMIVLYVIVGISQYMQDERKKELVKRKQVQDDFTEVVTEMFKVTLNERTMTKNDKQQIEITSLMVERLTEILGLPRQACESYTKFARIHVDEHVDLDLSKITDKDAQFERLKSQTELGNTIVKRLEISRRCEDIIRTSTESGSESELLEIMRNEKLDEQSQVVLIAQMYTALRSVNNYKRPYPHRLAIETMQKEFRVYFDSFIFERFIRFQDEFEKIFDNF